jgi:hypothetical protein
MAGWRGTRSRAVRGQLGKLEMEVVSIYDMAGYRITPVLVFWEKRELNWVKFTSETGFELPSLMD